ncbi:MAG: hypothetical protein EBR02_05190 [Alphaproteobacteria bacterium]|nr:hypothetical protein [Alphaproteobacteria bacterium]
MTTSSGTKAQKKQNTSLQDIAQSKAQEQALLALENTCARVLEARFSNGKQDMDGLYWQRKFHNIVTPVSLALSECKGPRHFHYHYKHSKKDDSVLQPVLENPVTVLVQVCKDALRHAETELVGIADDKIVRMRDALEKVLRSFLAQHEITE